jgi:hypothetical protein
VQSTFRTERIFILTALLFVGLGLTLAVSRGALITGEEQGAVLVWFMAAVLVFMAGAGSRWLRRGASVAEVAAMPDVRLPVLPLPLDAIVPAALAAGFVLFLQFFESGVAQALIVALGGLSFAALFWAQAHAVDTRDNYFGLAQSLLNLASYLTAFLFFSVVYGLKVRALLSATAVGVVAALLLYEMLARDAAWHRAMNLPVESRRRTLLVLSLVSGLVLAEAMWGLNYWAALTSLVGGAFLLVVFYVTSGLTLHYVDHNLTRAVVLEFAGVGALGVLAVFVSAFIT